MKTTIVRRFDNYIPANMILQRLQNEGIQCFLLDEMTVTIVPFYGQAAGGIKLAVAGNDVERAMELLADFDEDYRQSATCPKCGAQEISLVLKDEPSNILTAVVTWLFGSYSAAKKIYECDNCKYRMEDLPLNVEEYN